MKTKFKAIILLFIVILAAVAITAQVMPEEITEGIASAINDFRIKLVGRFDNLEYTILKSTKEKPVIYARDNLVRDRIVLDGAGLAEEFLPLPNGRCNVTVVVGSRPAQSSPPPYMRIWEAKEANILNNEKDCGVTFACSHTVNINDEFPMIRISLEGEPRASHLSVSYQCAKR